jgi:hypothetical protein
MAIRHFLALLLMVVIPGCSRPLPTTPSTDAVAEVVERTIEPTHVELTEATATINELNVIQFQVNYKFTSGKPVKFYMVEFGFPGTDHRRQKAMEAWEMKPEGWVKSGVELPEGESPVEFTVTLSEADSPDRGYSVISNTLNGRIAAKN